ncbi:hypothetical protein Zmor_027565 [Zophobas morio]|uniref:Uncharacterized protein n=1 Tax=Zophobas morio TaxID=2755281 RepID=A0AA38HQU3_9CUCU|nr:hypothetical protein Zmor_027565 [Zophobas morio]
MFTRSLTLIFLATYVLSVLSHDITFNNMKIEYVTVDGKQVTVEINSASRLKNELYAAKAVRVRILEGSFPVIYADAFSNLPVLRDLQLSGREVEEIHSGAFNNVPALVTMKLSRNKITTINEEVFSNSKIRLLDLDHNLIENISPHAFDNMPKLEALNLSHNKIKNLHPEWFQGKPKLGGLSVRHNQIENLPSEIFANYHNDVDLQNNKIKKVSRNIFGSDDKIVFGQLWLGYNEIEEWKEDFVKGGEVRALMMMANKIQCLEGNYENFFVALQTYIDDNPWDCECLLKIAKWAVDNQKDFGINVENSAKKCNSTGDFPTMII